MERKIFETLIALANQFERASDDKYIELIYSTNKNSISIVIRNINNSSKLKEITYYTTKKEDIDELVNMMEMLVEMEV